MVQVVLRCLKVVIRGVRVGAVAFGLARSVGGSERKRRSSVWLKKDLRCLYLLGSS